MVFYTFFKESNMAVQNLRTTINFYEKCRPVITWNKKHSLKENVLITNRLERRFFGTSNEGL